MAALIPGLISAIMGSGYNKNFDPKDPNSKPYEERKTGMGRFLQRWGSGVDSGELNNEYSAKRRENEAGREQQIALQKSQQEFTSGRDDKNNTEDWKRTQSHLANQAALEQIRQAFQARMQAANMAQDQSKQNQDEARRLFEQTGTWDPIKQQEVMEKIRTQRMDEPRSLSGGIVYDPSSNQYIYNEQPGYAIGPDGKSMVHNPGGLRATPRSLQSGMTMPAAGSGISSQPQGGGRLLKGNPEELRQMLLGPTPGSGGESVDHGSGGMGPGPASGESSGSAETPLSPEEQAISGVRGFSDRVPNKLMSFVRRLAEGIPSPTNKEYMTGVRQDFEGLRERIRNSRPDIVSQLLNRPKRKQDEQAIGAVRGF